MSSQQRSDRGRTMYECVDANPEYVHGDSGLTLGATFYFTMPECSGPGNIAHCPPYAPKRQLTCVVCTK